MIVLGLAFGLGGRGTAYRIVCGWYERSQEAAPRLARAASTARDRVQRGPRPIQEDVRMISRSAGRLSSSAYPSAHDA